MKNKKAQIHFLLAEKKATIRRNARWWNKRTYNEIMRSNCRHHAQNKRDRCRLDIFNKMTSKRQKIGNVPSYFGTHCTLVSPKPPRDRPKPLMHQCANMVRRWPQICTGIICTTIIYELRPGIKVYVLRPGIIYVLCPGIIYVLLAPGYSLCTTRV